MNEDDLQDRRRTKLRRWISARGGVAEVLAKRPPVPPSYASFLSQLMKDYSFGSRAARRCEERLGMPAQWLDQPEPSLEEPPEVQRGESSIAHHVSLPGHRVEPKRPTWEQLVAGDGFGELFETAVPDDANTPDFPRGLMIIWSTNREPQFGSLVLVRDRHGQLHARTYHQGKAPGHWIASASNRAYATFDSQEDGLKIEAVAAYRGLP